MKFKLTISIDTKFAKEIEESLNVDNVNLPEGMEIKTFSSSDRLIIEISIMYKSPSSLLTLRNTADEILQQIDASMKITNTIRDSLNTKKDHV
ncbi:MULTISPECIES: KEOPS complex subunit Pcc1 [Acidianus]|uniref:KEOPS complex Pcc1-like subunit n=1 Tax=Candidatus Acidianus copahuensis TaxID=1160895 RepID=A0A031LMT6_9CREN|nr:MULTISPECIES: KEOPS complex subunit Pcc1 [Acidianus]EZQ06953.1 hypothetical protein CM19_06220 [Candidatus Acidianus copahuensis]